MLDISIIIVTHNNRDEYLRDCLEFLKKACSKKTTEIVVVDNNSLDGTVEWLKKEYPYVKVIANKENIGFARANNQGLSICRESKWILLLNPDTRALQDSIDQLVQEAEKWTNAGVFGPMLLNEDGSIQKSCRNFPSFTGEILHVLFLDRIPPFSYRYGLRHWNHQTMRKVEWLSGACMLIPRQVADQAGLFDERFFMYSEDMDLCYRIHKLGRDIVFVPKARVIHFGGGSSKKQRLEMLYELFKSKYLFIEIHFGAKAVRRFRQLSILGLKTRKAVWFGLYLLGINFGSNQKVQELNAIIKWHFNQMR